MIKAVGYPVYVDTGSDAGAIYSIYVDGELIFTGQSVERIVDIAPLLRDYLNSERIVLDWPTGAGLVNATAQLSAGIAKITGVLGADNTARIYVGIGEEVVTDPADGDHVVIDLGDDAAVYVANDYNEDCRTDFSGYPYITSVFVRNEVDRRQICFFGANTSQAEMRFDVKINGDEAAGFAATFNNPSVIVRSTLSIADSDPATLSFDVLNPAGLAWESLALKLSPCRRYRYALYAVNRAGGVTHIVCEGKSLQSYTKSNWDIITDYNRLSQTGRGERRMSVSSTRRWRLNTGYLTEAEARHIDDLVTSPRILLHDLEAGRLFAVNSNDSSIERRTRESNGRKPIEYTLTVEEARTEIRR